MLHFLFLYYCKHMNSPLLILRIHVIFIVLSQNYDKILLQLFKKDYTNPNIAVPALIVKENWR
jgi:hypothetical protein